MPTVLSAFATLAPIHINNVSLEIKGEFMSICFDLRKHQPIIIFIIISLFLGTSTTNAANNDNVAYIEDCCCHGSYALHLPKSVKALRSLGKLKSEKVLKVEDWETYKTETRELIFEGLRLVVITFTNNKPYMIQNVNITSRNWAIAPGLRVGGTLEDVKKQFRGKASVKGEWIEVAGDTDFIRIHISKGKIVEIEYQCYTG
jgi:hypothetical protein